MELKLPLSRGAAIIRAVRREECALVAAIAAQVSVRRQENLSRGFLVHTHPAETYAAKIPSGELVCLLEYNNTAVGLLVGVFSSELRRRLAAGQEVSAGQTASLEHAARSSQEPFFFLDQFALAPQFQDQHLGRTFFELFSSEVKVPIYLDVHEGPHGGNPRVAFWRRMGLQRFTSVEEKLTGAVAYTAEPVTWGVYCRPQPPAGC